MKLTTIWTIPTMSVRERLHRTRDWAAMGIAYRLPTRVRYWAFVFASLDALDGEVPSGRTFDEVHQRVNAGKGY